MSDENLEWDLSVDADTSGGTRMDTMLGRIDASLVIVNKQLMLMEAGTRKTGKAHEEHGKHAEGLRGSLDRLIHQGMEPFLHKAKEIAEFEFIREGTEELLHLPGELAEKIKELGEEMIMTAAKEERMGRAFRNALGDEDAEKADKYINNVRRRGEFSKNAIEDMTLELSKAGYKGEGIAKAYGAIIDLAAMSPNAQEGASRALSALERVQTTGKLEARALVPFGISEKALLGELGRETGMSSKDSMSAEGTKVASQVEKALQAGRIPIETELNALYTLITKKTGKALGGAGADMETTLDAKVRHLKELPELFYERLAGTTGYSRVSEQVSKLLDGLDPDSPRGKRIFASLELAFNHIGDIMAGFDLAGTIEAGIDALDLFATEFVDLLSLLPGETGKHAGEVAGHMKERRMAEARKRGEEEAEAAAAAKDQAREKDASRATADFYASFPAAERAKAIKNGMYDATDDETPFLVKGIDKAKGDFERAGEGAGHAIETGTRRATKTHSPSEVFADIGRDLADGVGIGMAERADQVGDVINRVGANALGGLSNRSAAGGGSPTIILQIQPGAIHIDGAGANADEIAQAAIDRLAELAPSMLASAFEQIALQGGGKS